MKLKKNDIIIVSDADGKKSKEKWEIIDITGSKVVAIPVDSDDKSKKTFHCSRVLTCNGKDTDALAIAEKQTSINSKFKTTQDDKPDTEEVEEAETVQADVTKIDLSNLTTDGSELYSKKIDGFNHEVEVISYCLISADKKSYKYFNLYNGSLGKNAGSSIPKRGYQIKDRKNGYKKLLNSLKKKNYTKV